MRFLTAMAITGLCTFWGFSDARADTCGDYGTSVEFVETPSHAAKQALKEEKLVLVLHVSGLFEDPNLT